MSGAGTLGIGRDAGRAFAWLLACVVPGCASGDPTSVELFCSAMCERAHDCGGEPSIDTCQTACATDAANLDIFRSEEVATASECIRHLSCTVFFDENSFDPCWDGAAAELEPTEATRAFCRERSRTWFECGSYYPLDECERNWLELTAAALDRVAVCNDSSACDAINDCTRAALAGGQ